MIKTRTLLVILLVLLSVGTAQAAGGWKVCLFGIDVDDFKNKNWTLVSTGVVMSFVVHELGHLMSGHFIDPDVSLEFADNGYPVPTIHGRATSQELVMFGSAGWALQTFVGTLLTLHKDFRHTDFMVGWNAMSAIDATMYTYEIDNPLSDALGDVGLIDRAGGNGVGMAGITASINWHLLHYSLEVPDVTKDHEYNRLYSVASLDSGIDYGWWGDAVTRQFTR